MLPQPTLPVPPLPESESEDEEMDEGERGEKRGEEVVNEVSGEGGKVGGKRAKHRSAATAKDDDNIDVDVLMKGQLEVWDFEKDMLEYDDL